MLQGLSKVPYIVISIMNIAGFDPYTSLHQSAAICNFSQAVDRFGARPTHAWALRDGADWLSIMPKGRMSHGYCRLICNPSVIMANPIKQIPPVEKLCYRVPIQYISTNLELDRLS